MSPLLHKIIGSLLTLGGLSFICYVEMDKHTEVAVWWLSFFGTLATIICVFGGIMIVIDSTIQGDK